MPELTVFVSHKSSDATLAKALVELLEKALKLPARQVRCTSVDGYGLPVGADTDGQLRREVFEAQAFLGIVTPSSLSSAYVLFELGARWGARKHLAPLLARGAGAGSLGGPLAGINALRIGERNQVVQLVEDIADCLSLKLEPAASFQGAIDRVVAEANQIVIPASTRDRSSESEAVPELDTVELELLKLVADGQGSPERLATLAKLKLEKTNYYLAKLQDRQFIRDESPLGVFGEAWWKVLQPGREFLVRRELL